MDTNLYFRFSKKNRKLFLKNMENLYGGDSDSSVKNLIQISQEEIDIINDIRGLKYGRINLYIQDGIILTKEVTKIAKRNKNNKYKGSDSYET